MTTSSTITGAPVSFAREASRIRVAFVVWLLLMTTLAAGFRFYRLGEGGMWTDEINTVLRSAELDQLGWTKRYGFTPTAWTLRAFGVPLEEVSHENIGQWRAMGITEFRMRLAAVVFGIAAIPLIGLASRRMLGDRTAVALMLLLAVSPWHIWMSQSARFYSQQFLFASLCVAWYLDATSTRSRPRMLAAMACLVLAFVSQPPALVLVCVFAADWLIGIARREPVRLGRFGWIASIAALGLCIAGLAVDWTRQPEDIAPFLQARAQSPRVLALGAVWMVGPVIAFFAGVSACALWIDGRRRLAVYLSLAALVPIVAMVLIAFRNFVHFRYMFVCLFGWLVLASFGAEMLRIAAQPRVGRLLAHAPLAVLVVASLVTDFGYFTEGNGFRNRWREASDYIRSRRAPAELVCSSREVEYFLGDTEVIPIASVKSCADLRALGRPIWLAVRAESSSVRGQYAWLEECAELRAYFDTRVLQPYSSIRVYYHHATTGVH